MQQISRMELCCQRAKSLFRTEVYKEKLNFLIPSQTKYDRQLILSQKYLIDESDPKTGGLTAQRNDRANKMSQIVRKS